MTTRRLLVLVAAAILAAANVAACQAPTVALAGHRFLSFAIVDNGAPKALVPGTQVSLSFEQSAVSASVGCNSMSGSYELRNGRLSIGELAMTDMGCDAARNAQDMWLMNVLRAAPTVTAAGNELTIDGNGAVLHLRDERAVTPDQPIAGTTWIVDTLITGDAVSSVPQGIVASVLFHADGTVDVDDGCNQGSGRWQLAGAGIVVTELAMTKKACAGPAGAMEDAVLATLRGPSIDAAINGNRLVLRAGAHGLGLIAR